MKMAAFFIGVWLVVAALAWWVLSPPAPVPPEGYVYQDGMWCDWDVCIRYVDERSTVVVAVLGGLLLTAIGIGMMIERRRRDSAPGL